jgi:adenine-specific DNA-methyltransferase
MQSRSTVPGRLTLNWLNDDQSLISNGETGYRWVARDDPRVREVRLIDEVDRVGDASGTESDNLLIRGDSLDALRSMVHSPEYAKTYRGKVKLVYIDPPFNTGQAFEQYDDSLEHSVWLGMMRERLILISELLAPDGSVWVHLDDVEMAYCKVLMDEIFGRHNFVATVVWQKLYAPDNRTDMSTIQDYIMVFTLSRDAWKTTRNLLSRSKLQDAQYKNPDNDPRGRWKAENFSAKAGPGRRKEQFYPITSPSGLVFNPPPGRCWVYTEDRYRELLADGLIWFGAKGTSGPAVKRFIDQVSAGVVPGTWWGYEDVGHNQEAKQEIVSLFKEETPFATPKPERLLERVIHISTKPGDIVVDVFAGSGTTAAVAQKMGRRWVTVELNESTVDTFTKPRLEKVVAGEDPGGITMLAGWIGGGGFRDVRIAASSWDVLEERLGVTVYQGEETDGPTLVRAVTAQLGFAPIEHPIFSGAKGRSRLAVVPGVVDVIAVQDIISALNEGETVLVAALSITDDASITLRELARGSRLMRIPNDMFPPLLAVTR